MVSLCSRPGPSGGEDGIRFVYCVILSAAEGSLGHEQDVAMLSLFASRSFQNRVTQIVPFWIVRFDPFRFLDSTFFLRRREILRLRSG